MLEHITFFEVGYLLPNIALHACKEKYI